MKKIGKLQINNEKILKEIELRILRGGDDYACCKCATNGIVMAAADPEMCNLYCGYLGSPGVWVC